MESFRFLSRTHTHTHTRASSDVSNLGKNLVNLPATVSSLLFSSLLFFLLFFRLFLNLLVVSLPFNIFSCYRLFGFGSSSLAISFLFFFFFFLLPYIDIERYYLHLHILSSFSYGQLGKNKRVSGKNPSRCATYSPFLIRNFRAGSAPAFYSETEKKYPIIYL